MERYARLAYTSNPQLQEYVGSYGYLSCDEFGRYAFRMDNTPGLTIQTSAAKVNSVLGDIKHPVCRNLGFETRSGSAYQFDFMDVEKLHDGARVVDNTFLGYEHSYGVNETVQSASQRAHELNGVSKTDVNREYGL